MALRRRGMVMLVLLMFYWPVIFILTHLPLGYMPDWVSETRICDKAGHHLAYLALAFFWWFVINPYEKVSWRKITVWWALAVIICYGAIDEWLQSYVGRSADIKDFFADLSGALTGFILLSIFSFWPAALIITGLGIFILTNISTPAPAASLPYFPIALHLSTYAFFSILWIQYLRGLLPLRPHELKWLIGAFALPLALLLCTQLFAAITQKAVCTTAIIAAAAGILTVVTAYHLAGTIIKRMAKTIRPG